MSLDDVIGVESLQSKSHLFEKNEMAAKVKKCCKAYKGVKEFEMPTKPYDNEEEDKDIQKIKLDQAKRKLRSQLERQKKILVEIDDFNEEDQTLYDKIIADEIEEELTKPCS